MLHLPFKFRELSRFTIPRGPNFDKARPIQFSLNGNVVQLQAPNHSNSFASMREIYPRSDDYDIDNITGRSFNTSIIEDDSWKYFEILERSWSFYGPLFTGNIAELSLGVHIIIPNYTKEDVSFFHPRAFEQSVGDFISARYARETTFGRADWIAPVDWRIIDSLPTVAATFCVMPDPESYNGGIIRKYFFFPVNDQRLVMFSFGVFQFTAGRFIERDKLIDRTPMEKLATDIIHSVRVQLSPTSQAQQQRALQGLKDTSLRKEFPPMKWTTPEQDAEWEAHVKLQTEVEQSMAAPGMGTK